MQSLLEEAIKLRPREVNSLIWLAITYFYAEDYSRAEKLFQLALKIEPNSSMGNFGFSKILLKRGELEAAEKHLRRSIESEPSAGKLTLLAEALERQGRKKEAELALEEALNINSEFEEAYITLRFLQRSRIHYALRHI